MNTPENPPAFPQGHLDGPDVNPSGMSLRDYFAAKFSAAQISMEGVEGCDKEHIAAMAYEMADALLKARAI